MKAELKTTFDHYGKYFTGHIEDAEMYRKVKNGIAYWKETVISRITHIRIPKEVFERLLELDRNAIKNKQREGEFVLQEGCNHLVKCTACGYEYTDIVECTNFCGNCGAKMKGGAE